MGGLLKSHTAVISEVTDIFSLLLVSSGIKKQMIISWILKYRWMRLVLRIVIQRYGSAITLYRCYLIELLLAIVVHMVYKSRVS